MDISQIQVRKTQIINNNNPEWGKWTVTEDTGEWYVIRGQRQGSRVLFYDEAEKFWHIAED